MPLTASGCKKAAPPATPPPPVVQVMEVAKTKVARSTTFIGQLDSPQNVEVRARVEAFLDKILFTEGSEVQAGDPLFELDKKPYEEKLAAAKGMLAEAKAALSKSNLEVPRLKALVAQNAAPQKDLDTAVAAKESNEAKVASAEAQVKSAELDLGYCDVKAPLAGRIGAKEVPVGSLVGKGEPTLLATISQVDPIWFYCAISEVDYLQAERLAREAGRKMGELPVHLILADGTEHPEPGKWVFVDRVVDATTATIRARAEFPNPTQGAPSRHVRPGPHQPPDRGRQYSGAGARLAELQGKNFVWVVSADNKATQRAVQVAPNRVGSDVVILEGLKPGERVVVEGVQKLREGAPVQPMTAAHIAETAAPATKPAEASPAKQGETKNGQGVTVMADFFIRRPIVAMVIAILTVIVGLISLKRLPISEYPPVSPTMIQATTTYRGAAAEAVMESVATPIESKVNGVDKLLYMQSYNANDGKLTLNMYFDVGTDVDIMQVNAQNRVGQAEAQLPAAVKQEGVVVNRSSPDILMVIGLNSPKGTYDAIFLGNYCDINLVDAIKRVKGVGDVKNFTAQDYSMRVWLRPTNSPFWASLRRTSRTPSRSRTPSHPPVASAPSPLRRDRKCSSTSARSACSRIRRSSRKSSSAPIPTVRR